MITIGYIDLKHLGGGLKSASYLPNYQQKWVLPCNLPLIPINGSPPLSGLDNYHGLIIAKSLGWIKQLLTSSFALGMLSTFFCSDGYG